MAKCSRPAVLKPCSRHSISGCCLTRQTVHLSWYHNGSVGKSPMRDAEDDFSATVHTKYMLCKTWFK